MQSVLIWAVIIFRERDIDVRLALFKLLSCEHHVFFFAYHTRYFSAQLDGKVWMRSRNATHFRCRGQILRNPLHVSYRWLWSFQRLRSFKRRYYFNVRVWVRIRRRLSRFRSHQDCCFILLFNGWLFMRLVFRLLFQKVFSLVDSCSSSFLLL